MSSSSSAISTEGIFAPMFGATAQACARERPGCAGFTLWLRGHSDEEGVLGGLALALPARRRAPLTEGLNARIPQRPVPEQHPGLGLVASDHGRGGVVVD